MSAITRWSARVSSRSGGPGSLAAALPWLAPLTVRDGAATAYVCRAFTCEQPVTTPTALAALFRE